MRNSQAHLQIPFLSPAAEAKRVWPACLPACRRLLLTLAVAVGASVAWHSAARAQVAAMVNGEPITALDLAQRQKFSEIATHKPQSRQDALDELIDEKLKLQIARHYALDISDKDVNSAYDGMATRAGLSSAQFSQALSQSGVNVLALKVKIKADIAWSTIIRGKFQSVLQVGQQDVRAALQSRKQDDASQVGYLYTLRQVLLLAPRGVPDTVLDARRKQAEELRNQFQSCEQGVPLVEAIKDATVRNPINRAAADVPAQQRQILDSTPVGHLTPPDVTQLGVEMFAVCGKQEIHGDSAAEREVRDQIANQRYEVQSKRYLEQLRRSAMIELR
jgi:peptidyl-prolyl cis-trans isomerase SurA